MAQYHLTHSPRRYQGHVSPHPFPETLPGPSITSSVPRDVTRPRAQYHLIHFQRRYQGPVSPHSFPETLPGPSITASIPRDVTRAQYHLIHSPRRYQGPVKPHPFPKTLPGPSITSSIHRDLIVQINYLNCVLLHITVYELSGQKHSLMGAQGGDRGLLSPLFKTFIAITQTKISCVLHHTAVFLS